MAIIKTCTGCGKEMYAIRTNQVVCSRRCKGLRAAEQYRIRSEGVPPIRRRKPRDHWCDFAGNRLMTEKLQEDFKQYQGLFIEAVDLKLKFRIAAIIKEIRRKYHDLTKEIEEWQ